MAGTPTTAQTTGDGWMSDAEALMWRLERHDARFRAVITIVATLERSPGLEALTHRADLLSRVLPCFRCRVAPPVGPWAPPRWETDEEFDVAHHVRVVGAPGEGTLDDVLAMAGPLSADGLDPARPLWQMILVEGMAGGRGALVVRLHHSFTDGLGALEVAAVLFDFSADAPVPTLPALAELRPRSARRRALDDLRHEVGRSVSLARRAVPVVGGLLRGAVVDPEHVASASTGMARSVARVVTPSTGARSPVMTGRSTHVELGHLDVALADVRDAARSAGATVNDVFVAAVLDGLRRYHAKHGSRPESLRVGMPISLRPDASPTGRPALGNHFFPTRMLAPLQIEDPLDRLRAVHALVAAERSQPALAAYDALAATVNRLSTGAAPVLAAAMASADVLASNVPGTEEPMYLAGARVLQLVPFGPRGGAGLNVTTVSYAGTLHVGVNMDPAATPDTATLMSCLADAFSEVVIYA